MKLIWAVTAPVLILCAAGPALAEDAAGRWAVAGNVDGKNFTLDCKFAQAGQGLSGACIDGPTGDAKIKGGESHPLLKGHAAGEEVSWTYESHFSFIKFKVNYTGARKGDHMSGTIAAAGKTGTFTGNRVGP